MILEDGVLDIEYEKLLMIVAKRGRVKMTGKEKTYLQMIELGNLGFVNIIDTIKDGQEIPGSVIVATQKGREYADDNGVTPVGLNPPKLKRK